MPNKVFIVSVEDCESSSIVSVHHTREGALKSWNFARLRLIEQYKQMVKALSEKETKYAWDKDDMYVRMIRNLECEDPDTINNYPHETPCIDGYTVVE
jgi:hypothetical protein